MESLSKVYSQNWTTMVFHSVVDDAQETPRERLLLARDSSRQTPRLFSRKRLLAKDSLRETPCKRLLVHSLSRETPPRDLRETPRERLLLARDSSSRETPPHERLLLARDSSLRETPPHSESSTERLFLFFCVRDSL